MNSRKKEVDPMSRNSKIGVAAIVLIAIVAIGIGAYALSYMPPTTSGSPTISTRSDARVRATTR